MIRALFFSALLLQLWPGSRLWAQADNRASDSASHPYRVSPETTRISGPLRQDGTLGAGLIPSPCFLIFRATSLNSNPRATDFVSGITTREQGRNSVSYCRLNNVSAQFGRGVSVNWFFPSRLTVALAAVALTTPLCPGQESTARHLYSISPETTRITGPLDETGSLDFYAALNKRLAAGSTAENNAARFIFGTWPDTDTHWHEISRLRSQLNLDALPANYPRQVPLTTFVQENNCPELKDRFGDLIDPLKPLDPEEFPLLARYIEANSPAIDAVVDATGMQTFLLPCRH